jgi:CMP-N-acetylneuraminic acid synthetase
MNFIAIIPARGGSKRLPGKNIKLFDGLPLISYAIKLALSNKKISKVIVSTDDDEIARVAQQYGAEIIRRPKEIAGDTATTTSALKHVLETIFYSYELPQGVITLQVTNPLRSEKLLNDCIEEFEKEYKKIDSVITVSENKHKLGEIENNRFSPTLYKLEQRSQDIKKYYFENGQIYITKSTVILEKESVFGDEVYPIIVNDIFSTIDIDTLEDFELGEIVYQKYKSKLNYSL